MQHTRTATVLLEGLHDPENEAVWREFDARFRPILHGFARGLGLSDADAADVAQESLTRFVRAYRGDRYRRERGRLSSWLIGIAKNCISDLNRKRAVRREDRLSAAEPLDPRRVTQIWEDACERHLLQEAIEVLRSESHSDARTIRAFERVAINAEPPAQVAADLGMTANAVYIAKNRCLTRLRAIVQDLSDSIDAAEDRP